MTHHHSPIPVTRLFRRLRSAALVFLSALVIGGLVDTLIGQGRWTLGESFYMTIITLSTVGFGETLPGMDTDPFARGWTVLLILLGSGTLLYFASTLTAFLVDRDLQGLLRRQRMSRTLKQVRDHVIVCGLGSTGTVVIHELLATNTPFVAIDTDREALDRLAEEVGPNYMFVHGDATDNPVLEQAGIARANGLIITLADDRDNLFVTVTARSLNEHLRIVAKGVNPSNIDKLRRAGADDVVSPSSIGGLRMASTMIRPTVVGFLDTLMRDPNAARRIEESRNSLSLPRAHLSESRSLSVPSGRLLTHW